ncbi:hypothetical protein PHMEG_00020418 [Phytophthora megakarya]|uniref:Uncharacterized protein n=1 Tax=Phytophthora megakarya TaxID=4795 RepID=A0A225VQP3_9STRA|nr:hypothetical protein PHMEG_00020418 [Phytophthora megakarya]
MFMSDYDYLLEKIQDLMRKLRNVKPYCETSGSFLENTSLRPGMRQVTHWDSTYKMIKRFYAIKDFIAMSFDELAELMSTRHEENKLGSLQDDLHDFKWASKKLQSDKNVTLLDVRDIFDERLERHPSVAAENSGEQHSLLKDFAVNVAGSDNMDEEFDRSGFAECFLRARKK